MTRRPGLPWLLAVAVAAAAGLTVATCTVDRGRYADKVYACDIREPDQTLECGTGYVCHPGTQIGTYDFCAPACTPGGEAQYCAPDGALLATCDPSAPACGADLQCLRTSVTANEGICVPVDVCGKDDECRDPLRRHCLAKVIGDAYARGLDPSMFNHLWCLQGDCNELSPCEAGHTCLGGIPYVQAVAPVCAPNCVRNPRGDAGVDDLCPRSFVCASKALSSLPYRFCLPGLYGFPCENDDQCLIGKCLPMGSHTKACSISCTTTTQCAALYNPSSQQKAAVACVDGQCVTSFSPYMQFLCDPRDNRCREDAGCYQVADLADAGIPGVADVGESVCWKTCPNGVADCASNGSARACLKVGLLSGCVPGVASPLIECDPSDPDACVKGLECQASPVGGKPYCTIPCLSDAPCQEHPWLPASWQCRGTAGNKVCAP